ncbi:acid-soluble spore protein H [Brevibacillus panacihumi W25]|uniref:Acid-soluble spore protein H n=2 Tax=Brevibacillus panacihumi TaxID=497735 RepID=V6M8L1_9BACL|nr:small acid-soluble spore protein H [Brevibacillus panacihumi]EST54215.1 acid-soluble spore protein H [Brevibacillus panacihumi W25]RNB78303.1 small acid-soluble spore protein H [Brevibacillus panacihumi]
MNTQRAKEIVNSPVMTQVTLNEVPVYIQHVDEETEMARVFPLDEPEREQSVPVSSLVEHR